MVEIDRSAFIYSVEYWITWVTFYWRLVRVKDVDGISDDGPLTGSFLSRKALTWALSIGVSCGSTKPSPRPCSLDVCARCTWCRLSAVPPTTTSVKHPACPESNHHSSAFQVPTAPCFSIPLSGLSSEWCSHLTQGSIWRASTDFNQTVRWTRQ